jgi:hypothetical protein
MRDITLDWDWYFDKYDFVKSYLIRMIKSDPRVLWIKIRRSANGRIHVWVRLDRDVDFWEALYLRARWDDDANRIRMDIVRYWEGGEVERLWDIKVDCQGEKCIIKRAGEWITIYQKDASSSSAV